MTFTVISGSTTDLLDRLNQGELDFLFALDFTQRPRTTIDFPDEDVRGVIINKHHPLANESAITADQLKEYPLAISRQSSFNDSLVEERPQCIRFEHSPQVQLNRQCRDVSND